MSTGRMNEPLDELILQDVYTWIDQIPLTRPKKNFARDFSDGGMVAEVVAHYFPKYVEKHNYPSTTVTNTKIESWHTLNRKVLRKLDFEVAEEVIREVVQCKPYVIERVLIELRQRIDTVLLEKQQQAARHDLPESDQYHHSKWRHNSLDQYMQLSPVNRQQAAVYSYNEPQTAKASPTTRKVKKFGAPPKQPASKQPPGISPGGKPAMNHQHSNPASTKKQSKVVSTMASSVVPKWEYEAKVQECMDKDETIHILMQKVNGYEELLQLKDIQIKELTDSNAQLKKKGGGPKPKPKAKF